MTQSSPAQGDIGLAMPAPDGLDVDPFLTEGTDAFVVGLCRLNRG
jgi:hypothetical protein